jgi:hypothetical protein
MILKYLTFQTLKNCNMFYSMHLKMCPFGIRLLQGSKLRGAREPVAPKNHVGLPDCSNREPGWLLKIILNFYPW